jgi:hypothetical protein
MNCRTVGTYLCLAGPTRELCCEGGQLLLQQLGLTLQQLLGIVYLWVVVCVHNEIDAREFDLVAG